MNSDEFPIIGEVTEEYISLRKKGLSRAAAVNTLCQFYCDELSVGIEDDAALFWIGLADAQYAMRELSDHVSQEGLRSLAKLENNHFCISKRDISSRRRKYAKAPMAEQHIVQSKRFRCKWNVGDTFAHRLGGEEARSLGIENKYALLHKVDDISFGDGRVLPVVTVSIWDDLPFPTNTLEFLRSHFLRMESMRLGSPKGKYEYRAEILFKNDKQVSAMQLEYVGNFADAEMPADEIIFTDPGNMMMLLPDMLDDDCCLFWKMDKYYSEKR